jgi:DNA modification methylase
VSETFLDGRVRLLRGDCLELLPTLEEGSIDSCVTDPPYHLTSIVKRFGSPKAAECQFGTDGAYARASKGFMGKQWDGGDIAFRPELWAEVLRVLKPGAHLLAFSGTRTYHRMACAIEDAGFEIRDQLAYMYGSGFPKSHNVSKQLSEQTCQCGLRSLPNPNVSQAGAAESAGGEILLAGLPQQGASTSRRSKLSNNARAEQPGMEGGSDLSQASRQLREREICPLPARPSANGKARRVCDGASASNGAADETVPNSDGVRSSHRPQAAEQSSVELGAVARQSEPQDGRAWPVCIGCGKPIIADGIGTALKPAWEPIVLARKPLSESSIAANVLKWGTGAINVDGCRVEAPEGLTSGGRPTGNNNPCFMSKDEDQRKERGNGHALGRWPANLIHDGSEEVVMGFPDVGLSAGGYRGAGARQNGYGMKADADKTPVGFGDSGSAARFFYTAKADSNDRLGSKHPTVKPVDLIQYLTRLVTPQGGLVLDPFAGTGTTGEAAWREGLRAVLVEREEEYQADIVRRMGLCLAGPDERARESIKASGKVEQAGPLFEVLT